MGLLCLAQYGLDISTNTSRDVHVPMSHVGFNILKFGLAPHDILLGHAKHNTKYERVLLSWVVLA